MSTMAKNLGPQQVQFFLKLNEFEVLESYHSLYSIHLIHSTPKTILLLLVPYFTFEP